MSQETMEWLNTRVLVGFTEKRGHAWHYRAEENGEETNHYPGPIPVEDVNRRLFHWTPAEGTVETTYITEDGVHKFNDESRKAIVRPAGTFGDDDEGAIFGVFKQGFTVHNYSEWLLENSEYLLGSGLHIGSAGLLKGGAVAWVQIELPETLSTSAGVEFRPFLTAATSLDGSLATTYQTGATVVVCDNTLSAALGESSALVAKVYHSRYSHLKVNQVRESLNLVEAVAENMDREIEVLTNQSVTDSQWQQFLVQHVFGGEVPEKGRGRTIGQKKADRLDEMYRLDERVAPWNGTAWGVLSAVNTYEHHEATMQGGDRVGRNATRNLNGGWDKLDAAIMRDLEKVLA